MSIRSVQQMMNYQTLEYVFPFSGFEFETDVNVIITTEGRQSTFFEVSGLAGTSLNISIHDYFRQISTFPLNMRFRRV